MHYLDHLLECPIGPSLKVLQLRRLFDWTNMVAALYIQHCMDLQLAVDPYKRPVLFERTD